MFFLYEHLKGEDTIQFSFDQGELHEYKGDTEHAFDYFSEAAEFFLKAYRGYASDSTEKILARENFSLALERAEQSKKSSQHLHSPPIRTRSSSSVSSTDPLSLHRIQLGQRSSSSTSFASIENPTDDILTQRLSAEEIEVLKYTSCVNDKTFLPWIDETDLKEQFSYEARYVDPEGSLRLSEKQLEKFGGWKRPIEMMRHPQLIYLISRYTYIL